LPRRMVDILEGESLLNDATALLALEFGIGLLMQGHVPTFTSGLLRLCYLTAAGIGVDLFVGEIVHLIEHRIDDAPIEIALSILTCYIAYLAADFIHASGVLAVSPAVFISAVRVPISFHRLSACKRGQSGIPWHSS
jgi:monovalent cation/hydrogen antiporter